MACLFLAACLLAVASPVSLCLGLPLDKSLETETPDVRTRHYQLRQNGVTIGTVTVKRQHPTGVLQQGQEGNSHADVAPTTGATLSIESKNFFERNGETFETGWETTFIHPASHSAPIAFDYASHAGRSQIASITGAIDTRQRRFEIMDQHHKPIRHLPLNADLPFVLPESNEQEALFKAHYQDPAGARFAFQTLELGTAPRLVSTHVVVLAKNHGKQAGRRFQLSPQKQPQAKMETGIIEWRNAEGELLKASLKTDDSQGDTELLYAMQAVSPTEEARQKRNSLNTIDAMRDTRLASAYIPNPRSLERARYRISLNAKAPSGGILRQISQQQEKSQRQQVLGQTEDSLTVAVSADPPLKAFLPFDNHDPYLAQSGYLSASGLIDATDANVRKTAQDILAGHINAKDEIRPYYAAQLFRRWVFQHLENKTYDVGFASASQALAKQSGDCTEHAVLLSALLRAAHIPSRVAVGLLYVPDDSNAMPQTASRTKRDIRIGHWVFHLWSEALVGRYEDGSPHWASLDASQPNDLVDAAHIKLGDSALANLEDLEALVQLANQASRQLRIDILSAASPQESVVNLNKMHLNQMGTGAIATFTFDQEESNQQEDALNQTAQNDATQALSLRAQAIPALAIDLGDPELLFGSQAKEKRYRISALPGTLSRSTAEGALQQGIMLLEKDRYAQAQEAFEDALAQEADNPVALLLSARRLFSLEMYREADHALGLIQKNASSEKSDNIDALQSSARALREFLPKNLSAAEQAQYQKALALGRSGQYEEAETLLRAFLKQSQNLGPVYGHLAQWQKAQNASELEVSGLYKQYQRLSPSDPRAEMALGELSLQSGAYAEAAAYWQSATLKASLNPDIWHGLLPESQAKLGIARALEKLENNRKNASAWSELGQNYQAIGALKQAVDAYQQALRFAPSSAKTHARLMQLAIAKGDWGRAAYDAMRLSGKSDPEALDALGYYWMRQRRYDQAIALLNQARQKSFSRPDLLGETIQHLSQAYLRRYDLYRRPADWQSALATIQQGIVQLNSKATSQAETDRLKQAYVESILNPPMPLAKSPRKPPAGSDISRVDISRSDYKTALDYARSLTANDTAYLDLKSRVFEGRLLMLLGRYDEANTALKQVLDINPYDADALAASGYLAQAEESPQQAMGYYQKALKIEPRQFMASQGLYTLLQTENLPLNGMSAEWHLSPDEHDYLRMWEGSRITWIKRQSRLGLELSPLLSDWGDLTLKAEAHRAQMLAILSNETQWLSQVYQGLKATPVPARFDKFQFLSLQVLYTDLQWLDAQKAFLPQFTSVSSPAKQALVQSQFKKAIANMNDSRRVFADYIENKLPVDEVVWEQIIYEATGLGPDDYRQLQADAKSGLDGINQQTAAKLSPQVPAGLLEGKGAQKPTAIIDPSKLPSIVPKTGPSISPAMAR